MWCCSSTSTGVEPTKFSPAAAAPAPVAPAPAATAPAATAPAPAVAPVAVAPAQPVTLCDVELTEEVTDTSVEEYPAQGEEVPVLNRDSAQEFENLGVLIAGLTFIGILYLMMHETQDERPL